MKKMNTKTIIIIIALLAVFAFITPELMAIGGGGMTVNSVSVDTPIITENTNLKQVKYIIGTTFNSGGQSLSARITPSDVQQLSGQRSLYDFSIKVDTPAETLSYPIHSTRQPVYKYKAVRESRSGCSGITGASSPTYTIQSFVHYFTTDKICVYKVQEAVIGTLDTPQIRNSAKITVASTKDGGESYTKTIDTFTSPSVFFDDKYGNRVVDASWTGSLVTGNTPPSGANYAATFITSGWSSNNMWTLSPQYELRAYENAVTGADSKLFTLQNDLGTCGGALGSLDDCMNEINRVLIFPNDARKNLIGGTPATIGSAQTFLNRNSEGTGQVRITVDGAKSTNMNVVFKVSADWLGLVIPSGRPDILSVNCPDFSSGDSNGLCSINVKNIGSGAGTFSASLQDCGVFTQKYSSQSQTFPSGTSGIMNVFVESGLVGQELTSSCTFKVIDVNDPSKYDTMQADIHMTAPKACIPGDIRAQGQLVQICNTLGTGYDDVVACDGNEQLDRGEDLGDGAFGYSCVPSGGIIGLGDVDLSLNDINDFFNQYGTMLSILFIVMGVIALMLVFLIVKMYIKNLLGIK